VKERFVSLQDRRFCGERLAVNIVRARERPNGAVVTANEGRVEKLVVGMSVVAVMSDDWESIAAVHLDLVLVLLLSLDVQILLM
jgi:hypothetical protein